MNDGARPTSTDLMAALEEVKQGMGSLRTDVSRLVQSRDDHAGALDDHGRRIDVLESQQRQHRELVTRLHDRISELSREVTVVRNLLERSEEITRQTLRGAFAEASLQMVAAARAELFGLRSDLGEIAKRLDARPCVAAADGCVLESGSEGGLR